MGERERYRLGEKLADWLVQTRRPFDLATNYQPGHFSIIQQVNSHQAAEQSVFEIANILGAE